MVFGHIPDVMAQKNGRITICEVETNDSLIDSSTIAQWKAFDRSGYEFHVVVPHSGLELAKAIATQNSISVDFYWYNENY